MQSHDVLPKPPQAWFFVVDGGRGRLLRCSRVPHGRLHVDEVSAIEYRPEEHERGRPSPRTGKSGNTYASRGREDEYQIRRFAKEVVDWIAKHADRIETPSITLFAAPRFLGELRKLYGPALSKRIDERQGDLTQLSRAGLAKHPAVTELLPD
jgi:protein required for attachment to host cells